MRIVLFATLFLLISGCRSQATPDPRIAQLESQMLTLKGQIADLQKQNADTAEQRDACNAKFSRSTFLYDVGLFNTETRSWVIPADLEPVLAAGKNGTFSHYDPKTQTESVHFKGNATGK